MANQEANWYVVHTYSGYENKVATNLEKMVENHRLHDFIQEVKIPTERVIEVTNNKRKEIERKLFPGYVLVKMVMTDESWYIVRNTRGVTGFVGSSNKPIPLSQEEIDNLGVDLDTIDVDYAIGDNVKINEGPLAGYIGVVEGIDSEHQKVKLKVSMFGRETSAELDISGVTPV
ncbi:MAG: transcription termination/antitermination protein NusG [Oscillospiraceae bacterium]|nr:transcription termination/antitermination protein NusG [Oscillospiraceae bacterium]MBR2806150.1 transcription termination/antitermination protein NusG [Oscillospiraceae bacterium]